MCFEDLTMVPIDKDLINKNLLNKSEKKWLNNYHMTVFNILKNSMNKLEILHLNKLVQLFKFLFQSFLK